MRLGMHFSCNLGCIFYFVKKTFYFYFLTQKDNFAKSVCGPIFCDFKQLNYINVIDFVTAIHDILISDQARPCEEVWIETATHPKV